MQRATVRAAQVAGLANTHGKRTVVTQFRDAFGATKSWVNAPNNKAKWAAYFQAPGVANPAHPTYLKGSKDQLIQTALWGTFGVTIGITLWGIVNDMRLGRNKASE